MNSTIFIDPTLCTKCKSCTEICPNVILEFGDGNIKVRPEREKLCFGCGQCMAACSGKAIQVNGLSYEKDFFEFSQNSDFFQNLIETRRSIRAFKEKPVPKEELEKIVEAITYSPPSFPPIKTEVVVVNDKKFIQESLPEMVGLYVKLMKGLKSPVGRYIIRKKLGRSQFKTLTNHLVPLLTVKLPAMRAGTEDAISRNAQAVILFHANKNTENYHIDIQIALTFAMLKAHSLGIGACVIELIPPAIERVPGLKEKFGIPPENEVVASLILGYPKFKYKRGIKRSLKSVKWIGN